MTTLFPDDITIILTAGLVATACAVLGVFLVLRRVALMGDAVSHAVLPGIVAVFLLTQSRAPFQVIVGAAIFAIVCVLAIEWLRGTGLIAADAAIGLVFPALFALGVLGVHRYAANIHLDLDSTIYGEIAFAPFRTVEIGGVLVAQSLIINGAVAIVNLALITLIWKELRATTFDPEFSQSVGLNPTWVSDAARCGERHRGDRLRVGWRHPGRGAPDRSRRGRVSRDRSTVGDGRDRGRNRMDQRGRRARRSSPSRCVDRRGDGRDCRGDLRNRSRGLTQVWAARAPHRPTAAPAGNAGRLGLGRPAPDW